MASTDREAIKELAKQSGMSMSDYVTACCLGKQVVVIDGLKEVLKELKSIGRNLNQLVTLANAKNFIAKARKFTDMTELTPELLRTFVAKIIVYEKEVKYSKHAPQKIHICFRDFNLNETDDMLLCGETTEKADSTIALPA